MKFRVLTQPEDEPISLAQARVFLRIDVPGFNGDRIQDSLIQSWIRAARQWVETETDCAYGEQTILAAADSFMPNYLDGCPSDWALLYAWTLPRGPVIEITSVMYLDPDGVDTLLPSTAYRLLQMEPQSIVPASGYSGWPATRCEPESVRVTYKAGYVLDADAGGEEMGHPGITAMRLLLGHFYVNRSASIVGHDAMELPLGVRALIGNSRRSIGV